MDFFAQQDRARRNTSLLVVLFSFAVLSLIALTNIAVLIFIAYSQAKSQEESLVLNWQTLFDVETVILVSLGVLAVVALAIMYKWTSLSDGGKRVAESLGGERIHPNTTDSAELRVLNIVEEMALASGMPVPPVYILKHEQGINAFAAGHTPADAVVGVTRGCINALDRDQLQGVIAHEFSHILNGDMRLNLRLIAVLHGIVFIGLIGDVLSHTRPGSSSKGQFNVAAFGFVLVVIGWLGNFFGQVIRAIV
ncbi:MAG: M48 family metalloprotease, partial [Pontibacterium sp.]